MMTRIRSRRTPRSAFTLIELLVVIGIIAVLVSLSAAAVLKILDLVPQVSTRTDISQLDAALGAFMNDYQLQDPPPSYLILREDLNYPPHYTDPVTGPFELRSHQFLKRVFGKNLGSAGVIDWNGDGVANGPWFLEGEQCLVFYLGGIPNTAAMAGGSPPQCQGFSTNNLNPAAAGGSRKGPYFNFLSSRLVPGTTYNATKMSPFLVYLDAYKPSTGVQLPYAYFSSYGVSNGYNALDGQYIGAKPYWTAQNATGAPTQYTNPNQYQIISAGKDGVFGGGLWLPGSGATGAGRDDQANFSAKLLGAGQS
jgi:prepilin-type N-terminal cleavage/methylation domain-containing protein